MRNIQGYQSALDLVKKAGTSSVDVDAIWQKLDRIKDYLDAQASAEFQTAFKEESWS